MATNENSITVSRDIDAASSEIFDLLTLPERHHEFDGSGMVRSDDRSNRIQAVGDEFTMNMHGDHMDGDYQTVNRVIAYAENERVGWQPRPADKDEFGGWEWVYEIESLGSDQSRVTLTYDWSKVEDKKLQAIFPLVSEEQLEDSLNQLAAAVTGA